MSKLREQAKKELKELGLFVDEDEFENIVLHNNVKFLAKVIGGSCAWKMRKNQLKEWVVERFYDQGGKEVLVRAFVS